jgi:4-alpha-glucanotransferase
MFPRASGILLHPTSLPGPFGVGDLGPAAFLFADFLHDAGQSFWQVLPLGPTGYGDSPYAGYSAFAGNSLLISPEKLVAEALLNQSEVEEENESGDEGDFGRAYEIKDRLLKQAFARFQSTAGDRYRREFETFVGMNSWWLNDYALFRALKTEQGGNSWYEWEPALARREPSALESARTRLSDQVESHKFAQFLFFKQWSELKAFCHARGVQLIGDLPIFVARDSADVWTNPDQFKLDADGAPTVVAGVPPDYFSATGQYWGNPLYNGDRMLDDGFRWWIARVRAGLQMFDVVRIDHFRGFAACWEIPAGDTTAERGRWVESPGKECFAAIKNALGELPIIAEDLGVITSDVEKLRDDFGFPGMRVLQFAFSGDPTNADLPHNYQRNVVVYTGTHDNDTAAGWFNSNAGESSTRSVAEIAAERDFCLKYLHGNGAEIHWDFIRAALSSVANTAIFPLQDVLGLGSEARMNLPNTSHGNWHWRFRDGDLSAEHAVRLREMTETYGRIRAEDPAES